MDSEAGDPWTITGYLGKADRFDEAMGRFALAYADPAEKDHAALKAAVKRGDIDVLLDGRYICRSYDGGGRALGQ